MRVRSVGWEDPLGKGMATHSSIPAWGIPLTEELAGCTPWGHKESNMTEHECTHHVLIIRLTLCIFLTCVDVHFPHWAISSLKGKHGPH